MLLNKILQNIPINGKYEIRYEREFETLGLTVSKPNKSYCTFLDNEKYVDCIDKNAVQIITDKRLYPKIVENYGDSKGICIVENPREIFFRMHNYLEKATEYSRKRVQTEIGKGCYISPLASIAKENVYIGDNVTIEEFVVIRENTVIGENTIIRAGAKIGSQGFEFKRAGTEIMSVCHLGGVKIGKSVEIQYNTCVDRAVYPWDDTVIGDFSKIDNLVHIGHAAKIDNNVMIVALSGIGGRTEIADNVWIGFGATVSNGLKVGKNSRANIGSVVTKDVNPGVDVTGNFAIDHSAFIQNLKNICSRGGGGIN